MKLRCSKKACAALVAFLILAVPVVACSQKSGAQEQKADSAVQASGSGSSGRTVIVGKVTAVVGNQVTLAVGNLNGNGSGGAASSSAAVSSGTSSSSSSSLITLTGETKTLLIPVGLTLSTQSDMKTSSRSSGSASGGSGGGMPQGGNGQAGGGFGGGTASGAGTRPSGSGGTAGGAAGAGTTTQRSSDFSSITTGMVLQIAEEILSDGTQGIVSVSVLSK